MSARGRPFPLGRRGTVVLAIALAAALSWLALDPSLAALVPRAGGARIATEFLSAAFRPALDYEAATPLLDAPPFLLRIGQALVRTVLFAAASMSLAIPPGLALGFLASSRWWAAGDAELGGRPARRRLAASVQAGFRVLIAVLRSVHELLWAVVFLAAFGLNTAAAVVALAIPFTGVLAKVFSELLEEAPRDAAFALRSAGAAPLQVFLVGTLPRVLADMASYAFYRFECAVRSSAVLGFFGYETLGYYLKLSFESLHYREVWSYLYALIALVLVLERWSAALRRRFVA